MPINVISKGLFFWMTCIEGSREETVSIIRAKVKTYCHAKFPDFRCPAYIIQGLWMWLMVVRTTHGKYRHGVTIVAQDPNRPSGEVDVAWNRSIIPCEMVTNFAPNVRWR